MFGIDTVAVGSIKSSVAWGSRIGKQGSREGRDIEPCQTTFEKTRHAREVR
jgi:hypothetical protein